MDIVSPAVSDYLLAHCTPADDLLRELAAETLAPAPPGSARAVSQLNETIVADARVESVMLPVRDGVTLARRR